MSNTDVTTTDDEATLVVDSKSIFESRRAWGAVMMVVPIVLNFLGVNLTTDQQAQLVQGVHAGQQAMSNIIIALGALQMIVGCWRARAPLHIGTPYQVDATTGKKIVPVKPLVLTSDVARIMDEKPVLEAAAGVEPKAA